MRLTACMTFIALAGCASHSRSAATSPKPSPANTITADDIDHAPGLSLEQLLLSRIPGLSLTRASDGHFVIHVRGSSSLAGEEEPLFVVNGIPLSTPIGGNLASINPRDIEYIRVLRDAAETALYGLRGTNGVILIKLKQS